MKFKKKSNSLSFKKKFLIVTLSTISILIGVFLSFIFIFTPLEEQSVTITIEPGSSAKYIALKLEQEGVVYHHLLFYSYILLNAKSSTLKAGTFTILPDMSIAKIGQLLTTQQNQYLSKITIPEGFSLQEISFVFYKNNILSHNQLSNYSNQEPSVELKKKFKFLNNFEKKTLEGYLFPDTYFFSPKTSVEIVVKTMLSRFDETIWKEWQKRPKDFPLSFHQALTLASIIEKEARHKDEMQKISGVFFNRLNRKMPLASDPTVIYALGKTYKQRVYYKDLTVNSPYNTYKYPGLPPGPIASPGLAAFKAALYPEEHSYFFFFAKSDGYHFFTKTYADHLKFQNQDK